MTEASFPSCGPCPEGVGATTGTDQGGTFTAHTADRRPAWAAGLAWLDRLNEAPDEVAAPLLHQVCASATWIRLMLAARPFRDSAALLTANSRAMAALSHHDLDQAVAAHPPIGRPTPGDARSAREQSGVQDTLRARLLELNLRYQDRFGQVFLICASGRSGAELVTALTERLLHSPEQEREIVRVELGKINAIRLGRLVSLGNDRG